MRHAAAALLAAALAAPAAGGDGVPACDGPAQELARRFTGTWQEFAVTDQGEQLGGRLDVTLEAGGCALVQVFSGADGAFSFRSLGHVDPGTGQWVETYVLSNGRIASYRWRTDGEDVVIDRIAGGDGALRRRLRLTFEGADAYRVVEETSPVDADAWTPGIVTMTRRLADAP